ncbi:hypothetical protein K458DRAFT_420833 [Lentithecium fluviatile CBS 122367]|uniref:Uncharacterized protein n=1 Tax=Lentithecium fluviatile CBS 122367 TaxID=1168545 RepID=A0A6G1ITM3_9PLEO|nr:hypothetical protein K458DRAFT_420833 [Lentithecium fluviatile CBS 122367]
MHTDRSNPNTSRPLKPTLATTRTAKTPVTPRLAPSVASASSNPSGRKPRSVVGSTPRVNTAVYEDVTPVKSFISSNVTPRSSARKSRVGVASPSSTPSSTPSGTPVTSRPASILDFPQKEQGHGYSGLGANGLHSAQNNRPRSVVTGNNYTGPPTPRLPLSNIYSHAPEIRPQETASPRFFHANDARPQEQPPPPQKKAPVFFYANGKQDDTARAAEVPSPPLSSVGRSQPESKFFHVDSLSEARSTPPALTPPPMSASPEPWANNISQGSHALRPPSPSKENMHLSYRKGVSQVLRPNLSSRPSALSILSGTHTPETGAERSRRRSSAASSVVRLGHAKSASLSSIDSTNSLKKTPSHDLSAITPSPLHNEERIVSNGSLPESVASAPPEPTGSFSGLTSPSPLSPTKTTQGQSALEHVTELAANARRERKVLDLEISNNSLLAINRSLEREVRKQKAELRRFRRMSRAGRFSTDTISDLEEFSAIGVSELGHLSDMSEEEEEGEEEAEEGEEIEDSGDSSFDESTLSADALADRDATHRLRDEKRLQLDLTKHRELLVDSQKMNQSLKRCMNWTEELIKEGKKALEYQVRVSDVQLGGRVLSVEERPDEEIDEESKTLLSPWTPPHRATDPLCSDSLSPALHTDRDSGIDLDGMQPILPGIPHVISPLGSPLSEMPLRPSLAGDQAFY